mmetsp:Transcript_15085/g.34061  ORF Transcript_15085/g.34061 Transcript_15085/m.34061 type:complete len:100 (+) Transcript_15085:120-419(+)
MEGNQLKYLEQTACSLMVCIFNFIRAFLGPSHRANDGETSQDFTILQLFEKAQAMKSLLNWQHAILGQSFYALSYCPGDGYFYSGQRTTVKCKMSALNK